MKERGIGWKSVGRKGKSKRCMSKASHPYKNPKFEWGLVKVMKKGGESVEEES
jgi:hypothetical protein